MTETRARVGVNNPEIAVLFNTSGYVASPCISTGTEE
jgi:hypothetical protein